MDRNYRITVGDTEIDTRIKTLGKPKYFSPIDTEKFINPDLRIFTSPYTDRKRSNNASFAVAGPREKIYFKGSEVRAAIVTCGGLCPGLNNVIRSLVMGLYHNYGVDKVFGIKHGLQGFIPRYKHPLVPLNPETVDLIHSQGGTVLGTSRGAQAIPEVVDTLERLKINILFIIGGDGTMRAAKKISAEIGERKLKISVIGLPKTIDNDIAFVQRSFGFDTAVDKACEAIEAAHTEARAAVNGIGLVKLMGRESGFIAATASLSVRTANYVLIPEADFDLEGEKGLLSNLYDRVKRKGHAVVVVAEGAGQKFFENMPDEYDKSGNKKLHNIGEYLSGRIKLYFKERETELSLKYIDPSYIIRSVPSNTDDDLFCAMLGQHAVHAAMAGKTEALVSIWHGVYVCIPIDLAITKRKKINLDGSLWRNVREVTGQPRLLND